MIRRILILIFILVLIGITARAQWHAEITVTVTNIPVSGNTLTNGSNVRTWTNASTASTIATNLTSKNHSATNLFNQLSLNPYVGLSAVNVKMSGTNAVTLSGESNLVVLSIGGAWATLSAQYYIKTNRYQVTHPYDSLYDTNRTNQAREMVYGISKYAPNGLTNSGGQLDGLTILKSVRLRDSGDKLYFEGAAGTNYLRAGEGGQPELVTLAGNPDTNAAPTSSDLINYGTMRALFPLFQQGFLNQWASTNLFTNTQPHVVFLFGFIATNALLHNSSASNFIHRGALQSFLTDASQVLMGTNAVANGAATAIGARTRVYQSAVTASLGLGPDNLVTNGAIAAIGYGLTASNLSAIGIFGSPISEHEIRVGETTHRTQFAGPVTNTTFVGTNKWSGDISYTPRSNTGLANGNNIGILLGSNVNVRISGPSAAYTNGGFVASRDGDFKILRFDNPAHLCVLVNDGLDSEAARRIWTGTGGDMVLTNNPAIVPVMYSGASNRWEVLHFNK